MGSVLGSGGRPDLAQAQGCPRSIIPRMSIGTCGEKKRKDGKKITQRAQREAHRDHGDVGKARARADGARSPS
jgi:hypothetical protein